MKTLYFACETDWIEFHRNRPEYQPGRLFTFYEEPAVALARAAENLPEGVGDFDGPKPLSPVSVGPDLSQTVIQTRNKLLYSIEVSEEQLAKLKMLDGTLVGYAKPSQISSMTLYTGTDIFAPISQKISEPPGKIMGDMLNALKQVFYCSELHETLLFASEDDRKKIDLRNPQTVKSFEMLFKCDQAIFKFGSDTIKTEQPSESLLTSTLLALSNQPSQFVLLMAKAADISDTYHEKLEQYQKDSHPLSTQLSLPTIAMQETLQELSETEFADRPDIQGRISELIEGMEESYRYFEEKYNDAQADRTEDDQNIGADD